MQNVKVKIKIIIVSTLLNPYLAFHFDIFNFQSAIYNCWLQNLTQIPEPVRNRFQDLVL